MSTPLVSLPAVERNPLRVYLSSLTTSGRRSMRSRLAMVARMFGHNGDPAGLDWSSLRFEHVQSVRARLLEAGSAPASVNTTLCALRGVARTAWSLCLMTGEDYHRICGVRPVRGSRLPSGRALEQSEIAALMQSCAAEPTAAGARDAAIIAVLTGTGMRRAEIVGLDLRHWDAATRTLMVSGKGNRERLVYLEHGSAAALEVWLRRRGTADGPLFLPVRKDDVIERRPLTDQAIYNVLNKRAREARIPPCSPHDFRRTFASDLIDRCSDLSVVKELLGHVDIQTTAGYDRRGETAKRRAVDLLHVPYVSRAEQRTGGAE